MDDEIQSCKTHSEYTNGEIGRIYSLEKTDTLLCSPLCFTFFFITRFFYHWEKWFLIKSILEVFSTHSPILGDIIYHTYHLIVSSTFSLSHLGCFYF